MTPQKLASFAGGGVAAIGPIVYARRAESALCSSLVTDAAMIGNSGGAIDAAFFCLGWRALDIENYWLDHMPGVFGDRTVQGRFAMAPKYNDSYVMEQLKKHMDIPLGKLRGKHIYIVAWDTVKKAIKVFSSEDTKDADTRLWYAVRASMAAPTYFEPIGPYYDGGLCANDPAAVGADAMRMRYGWDLRIKVAQFVTSGKQSDSAMPSKGMSDLRTAKEVVLPAVTKGNSANVLYSLRANGHDAMRIMPEHRDYVLDDVDFATECAGIWAREYTKNGSVFCNWWRQ